MTNLNILYREDVTGSDIPTFDIHVSTIISSPVPLRFATWMVSVVISDQNISDSLKISSSISYAREGNSKYKLTRIGSPHQPLFLLCQYALFQSWIPQSGPVKCDVHAPQGCHIQILKNKHFTDYNIHFHKEPVRTYHQLL